MYWFTGTSFSNAYKYHIEKKNKGPETPESIFKTNNAIKKSMTSSNELCLYIFPGRDIYEGFH